MFLIAAIPLLVAILCLLVKDRPAYEYLTLAGTALAGGFSLYLAWTVIEGVPAFTAGHIFQIDALSSYMLVVITLLSFAVSAYSIGYMRHELEHGEVDAKTHRYYYALINLFVFTMVIVPMANNLAVLWMAVEGTTLVSALLVGLYRKRESIEAAWKYIMLCTVGITFALLGTFIIYYASAGTAGEGTLEWTALNAAARQMNPATVKLAFILIIVGYGTKAGLAPVHNWLPDAHSEAPTPISALLSGILLNCAFYGIMRFAVITDKTCGHQFVQNIMFTFGIASVVMASIFILIQGNTKRLLAYSSIEHMGIITLSFGTGGAYGLYASLLHILNHAFGKPLMFFVTGHIRAMHGSVEVGGVKGVLKTAPFVGVLGFIGVLALTGMPPFSLFLSEFLMLRGLAEGGHWYIIFVFLAASGVVFYGFMRAFGGMFFGVPPADVRKPVQSRLSGAVLFCLGAGLLVFGLYIPDALDRLITMSVGVVGG